MNGKTPAICVTSALAVCLGLGVWAAAQQPWLTDADAANPKPPATPKPVPTKSTKTKNITAPNSGVPTKPATTPHTPPKKLLAGLLTRLHHEALEHFYADPRLGFARLPAVFQKVVRDWKTPEFSPGELGTDEPIPFETDMKRIHSSSAKSFLHPEPNPLKGIVTPFGPGKRTKKRDANKKVWEAKSVDLVGLIMHEEPVVYDSTKPSTTEKTNDKPATRRPDDFEFSGLSVLESGKDLYARSHKGVIRLLGAVRAKKSCIACHTDKKPGDLLGAFSYTLREAKYTRRTARRKKRSVRRSK